MFNFTTRITTESTRATILVTTASNVANIVGPEIIMFVVILLVILGIIILRKKRHYGMMYTLICSANLPC